MPDLHLECCDCDKDFYFKEKDQSFYALHGYDNPKRCWDCRQERKKKKQSTAKSAVYKKGEK
jgi:hypothetical protein